MVLSELAKNFLLYTSMTYNYFIPIQMIDWHSGQTRRKN